MLSEYSKLLANYIRQDSDVLTAFIAALVFVLGYALLTRVPRWRNQIIYLYMTVCTVIYLAASILIAGVKPQ